MGVDDGASAIHNPADARSIPSFDLVLAWCVYAAALEGRKKRENLPVTRTRAWLAQLQALAHDLGRCGMVL